MPTRDDPGRRPASGDVRDPRGAGMTAEEMAAALGRVRSMARLFDDLIRVPGTNVGIGLDALVGIVPGLGDVAGAAASAYVILTAAKLGVPRAVLGRMLLNVGTDALVGAVPVLGDLFDVGFKANRRNVDLLERTLALPTETKRASGLVVGGVILGVVAVGAVGITIAVLLARLLVGVLGNVFTS